MKKIRKDILTGPDLFEAASDYLYLLERKYPQASLVKLVGDHYKLTAVERSILYRGISGRKEAASRERKIIAACLPENSTLHIDGFNVLITIGSYLNGNPVFISNDGLLRDASEIHGKAFRTPLFDKAILLIFSYLDVTGISSVEFYFDEPVSHSGELCGKINLLIQQYNFQGHAHTYRSPDFHLKSQESGTLATSDTGIIDHCKLKVFDLARNVLEFHFRKSLPDIRNSINC
jgi:hypothetical protein